jgi:4-hydroxy-3-polyprenylbenzoate decarboxylase
MSSNSQHKRMIVAVTGASGALYALRFLRAALLHGHHVDLVLSEYGKRLLIEECDWNLKTTTCQDRLLQDEPNLQLPGTLDIHGEKNLGASIASGSKQWDAMIAIPCSMKTLSGIARGAATNLIERSADVTLKEQRPLILVPRESPMNRIHLQNLLAANDAGATIVPAMPAFYQQPKTFEDLADFIVGRVFSILQLEHDLFEPWSG